MAKTKANQQPKPQPPKPQSPDRINTAVQQYESLSETDKGFFLRRIDVVYLQSWWRPIHPTPELMQVINQFSRLSQLINTMMRFTASRRVAVEDLQVISEGKIRENVVRPIMDLLQHQCRKIEEVLNNQDRRQNKKGGEKAARPNAKILPETEAQETPEAAIELEK